MVISLRLLFVIFQCSNSPLCRSSIFKSHFLFLQLAQRSQKYRWPVQTQSTNTVKSLYPVTKTLTRQWIQLVVSWNIKSMICVSALMTTQGKDLQWSASFLHILWTKVGSSLSMMASKLHLWMVMHLLFPAILIWLESIATFLCRHII